MKKATVITVYDNDGKEIKNVSTEIVLNGETYVRMGTGKPLPPNPATKPIWETCREIMWRFDSVKREIDKPSTPDYSHLVTYSEEEVDNLLNRLLNNNMCSQIGDELIEQFKKKGGNK
jgi:hypothetical protein